MNKVIAYVYSYLSFLLPKIQELSIKNIILFGSATREELTDDSDIDLFIELYEEGAKKKIQQAVTESTKLFTKSNVYQEWVLRGVKYELLNWVIKPKQ